MNKITHYVEFDFGTLENIKNTFFDSFILMNLK